MPVNDDETGLCPALCARSRSRVADEVVYRCAEDLRMGHVHRHWADAVIPGRRLRLADQDKARDFRDPVHRGQRCRHVRDHVPVGAVQTMQKDVGQGAMAGDYNFPRLYGNHAGVRLSGPAAVDNHRRSLCNRIPVLRVCLVLRFVHPLRTGHFEKDSPGRLLVLHSQVKSVLCVSARRSVINNDEQRSGLQRARRTSPNENMI